jgi:hypothetical protein
METLKSLWSIFWRTFAQLTLAVLLAIQVPDLFDPTWIRDTAEALGVGLSVAAIGGVVAALWAFAASPATSALAKAIRSAAQSIAGTLGGIVITTTTDLLTVPKVLVGGAVTTVLAFAITYFQYQGSVPPEPTTSG